MVEQRMCQMIENIINRDMNSILSTMPTKIRINEDNLDIVGQTFGVSEARPLDNVVHKGPRNLTLLNFVNQLRERNLVLG
jgi:hypothetical protein